jgi:hypothetical protein
MFSDVEGVLDRLTKSTHLQTIKYSFTLSGQSEKILAKMAKLNGLRGVHLRGCKLDWTQDSLIANSLSSKLEQWSCGLLPPSESLVTSA